MSKITLLITEKGEKKKEKADERMYFPNQNP